MKLPDRPNTILYCRCWSETVAFYRDVLALAVNFENDWFVEFQLASHTYLSVADERRTTIDSVNGQGIYPRLILQPQLGRLQQMSDLLPGNAVARGRRFEPFTTAPPEPA